MTKQLISVLLLLASGILLACSSLRGYPKSPENLGTELAELAPYFSSDVYANYDTAADKKAYRNTVARARLHAVDLVYYDFRKCLHEENAGESILADWIVLGLSGAGATTPGAAAKAIFAAMSGGVIGAKAAVDKDAFYGKAMAALVLEMEAQRTLIRAQRIEPGLRLGVMQYDLSAALSDVEAYYAAGTIDGAIAAVSQSAGADATQANDLLLSPIAKDALDAKRIQTASDLMDLIDHLTDPEAIDLERSHPVADADADSTVAGVDPSGSRLLHGADARKVLKVRVSYATKSPTAIAAWDAALRALVH